MNTALRAPSERTCEICGRVEQWHDDIDAWRVADETGAVFCIHEWDVNGTFVPFDDIDIDSGTLTRSGDENGNETGDETEDQTENETGDEI